MEKPKSLESLQGKNIEEFSRQVYRHHYEPAMGNLIKMLDTIEVGGLGIGSIVDREESTRLQSIIAAAITALLCDAKLVLNPNGFSALMSLKTHLRTIFGSSAYRDMSHIANLVGHRSGDRYSYSNDNEVSKFLLATTLDTASDEILQIFQQLPDDKRLIFWLSNLDARVFVTQHENQLRHKLMQAGQGIENCLALSAGEMTSLARVWMNCSYWDYPDKHNVKPLLNRILKNTTAQLGVPEPLPVQRIKGKEKPVILVACEVWQIGHAMYRCYEPAIRTLKERFQVVGLVIATEQDDEANRTFDLMLSFNPKKNVGYLMEQIRELKPDMIYYPSVGMNLVVLQMAQYRLAPIQLMTAGHPASSFLEHMDYMVLEEDMVGDPETIAETILLTSREAFTYRRPDGVVPSKKPRDDGCVHVVVSSVFYKLSPTFVDVLIAAVRECETPVHFHFLAGLNAFNRIPVEREIGKNLPATFHELLPYEEYLEVLAQCDFQVAPFPFGNANGFVDAMLVGLPIICLDGAEVHSHTDAAWARRVGLPPECITQSVEEYQRAFKRLVDDEEHRNNLTHKVETLELSNVLFGEDNPEESKDFVSMLAWLYDGHELIQKSGRKLWAIEDREKAGNI